MVVRSATGDPPLIDFRYHLISIVAVLLALSVGVVLGSGLIGEPLLDDIKSNVANLESQLGERRAEVADLNSELSSQRRFAEEAAPYLLAGSLMGRSVVLIEIDGTDGGVVRDLRATVGEAGGVVVSRVEINERVALQDQTDRDSLALTLGSLIGDDPDSLRLELAGDLGAAMSAASTDGRFGESPAAAAAARLDALLMQLNENDFITLEQEGDGRIVPPDALFLVVGGAEEEARYDVSNFVTALSGALAEDDAPVMVTETSVSSWEIIDSVLDDGEIRDSVATSSGVDEVIGRIAAVLGLAAADHGEVDHYGRGPGASSIIPAPVASP